MSSRTKKNEAVSAAGKPPGRGTLCGRRGKRNGPAHKKVSGTDIIREERGKKEKKKLRSGALKRGENNCFPKKLAGGKRKRRGEKTSPVSRNGIRGGVSERKGEKNLSRGDCPFQGQRKTRTG